MLKKLIASTLSATFLCSSIMLDRIIDTPIVRDLPLADGTQSLSNNESNDKAISNGQYDLKATNSLGSYITNMAADHNSNNSVAAAPLSTDGRFEVSSLEYDNVTGDISICSSQTSACNVEVSFFNDETGELSFKVSQPVEAGDYVKTNAKADLSKLPQFYKINAQLVDKMGNPISNVFHENKYTQKIQEIIATDIHDFEPEQVVNLDESEQTNFLVLNEKTIKAESSETENTLVSADYENNVFVFDNVDDTLQNLQDGDLFYIQPTEKDIIAISVDDISIDDGKATVSGSPDIEEMFDFVKIETDTNDQEATVNTETADPDVSFPDHKNEKEFTYDMGKQLDIMYNRKWPGFVDKIIDKGSEYVDDCVEVIGDVADDIVDAVEYFLPTIDKNISAKGGKTFEHKTKFGEYNDIRIRLGFCLGFKANVYHKGDYSSFCISIVPEISITLNANVRKEPRESERISLGKYEFQTNFVGLNVLIEPALMYQFSSTASLSYKIGVTSELKWDSNDGWDPGFDPFAQKNQDSGVETFISGKLFVGFRLDPGIDVISDNLLCANLIVNLGLEAEVKESIKANKTDNGFEIDQTENQIDRILKENAEYSPSKNVLIANTDKKSIHQCDLCFDGNVNLVATADGAIRILGKDMKLADSGIKKFSYNKPGFFTEKSSVSISIPINILDFTLAFPEEDTMVFYFKNREDKCKYRLYRVDFKKCQTNDGIIRPQLKVTLDGLTQYCDSDGVARYYCKNGTYDYEITYYDELVKSGKITVDDSTQNEWFEFNTSQDEAGNVQIKDVTGSSESGTKFKMMDLAPEEKLPDPIKSNIASNEVISEKVQLGDNIYALAYPDGYVYVYGYGNMDDFDSSPFKDVKKIKEVYFNDADPEHGKYIKSIGNHVFDGAENLDVVYLSNQIKRIGDFAFKDCKNLKWFRYGGFTDETETFNLPTELIKIGDNAFKNCQNIKFTTEELPGSLEYIGNEAFFSCGKIESIIVPDNVTTIGTEAFCNCTSLKKAVIGKGVTSIGAQSFKNCIALEDLTLPFAGLDSNLSAPAIKLFNRGRGGYKETYNSRYSDGFEYYVPESLKSITITGGTKIPNKAFYGMSSLTSVTIPDNVTEIGENAFYNCSKLETFKLPSKLINIKNYAFKNCQNIIFTTEKLPGSLKYIGNEAFFSCGKIESIIVPDNVTTIGTEAFCNCTSLKKAVIGKGVTSIGAQSFKNCIALEDLTLPFAGLDSNLSAPAIKLFNRGSDGYNTKTYNSRYSDGFEYYVPESLKSITITGGTKIPNKAFYGMSSLTSVTIPDNVTEIGEDAFYNCSKLATFNLPSKLTKIGSCAFKNCELVVFNNAEIPTSVTEIGTEAFSGCKAITSIVVPDTAKTIGEKAFSNCTSLKKAVIGKGVTSIGAQSFKNCIALEDLTLPFAGLDSNLSAPAIKLFNRGSDGYNTKTYNSRYSDGCEYYVPESLESITITGGTKIPNKAFYGMSSLTSVTIPDNVTEIGENAFYNCSKLATFNLPSKLTKIGSCAFKNCELVVFNNAEIPTSVTEIGTEAFSGCKAITSIVVPDTAKTIGEKAFSNCTSLKKAVIGKGVTSIGAQSFKNCIALEDLTLPFAGLDSNLSAPAIKLFNRGSDGYNTKTYNSRYSDGCEYYVPESLKSITITGGTKIPNKAFYGMSSLTSVTVPDNVTEIGENAFYNCSKLATFNLPSKLTKIGSCAFKNCELVVFNNAEIPTSVTEIGTEAFSGCKAITSIVVPDTAKTIGEKAFSNCTSLKKAVIGKGVTSIGAQSFKNCIALEDLTLPFAGLDSNLSAPAIKLFNRGSDGYNTKTYNSRYSDGCEYYVPESLESITITGGKTIPDNAFYGMKSLTTVILPDTITEIGENAFNGCSGLDRVYINNSEDNWNKININDNGNGILNNVKKYFISKQPSDLTAAIGSKVEYSVEATGEGLTYQWQYSYDNGKTWKNSTAQSGKTATLKFILNGNVNSRLYRCVINNEYITKAVKLTVVSSMEIIKQPEDVIANKGDKVSFSVEATGDELTYQWQYSYDNGETWKNTTAGSGKSATMGIILNGSLTNRLYRCVITDKYGFTVESEPAMLTIVPAIEITSQPTDVIANKGDNVSFSVEATGDELTYQWQYSYDNGTTWKNTTVEAGKNATMGIILNGSLKDRLYRCVVTDKYGFTKESDTAKLTIVPAIEIISQPEDVTANKGDKVYFSVEATGDELTYQWQYSYDNGTTWKDTTAESGKKATMGIILNGSLKDRLYRCVVTDKYGFTKESEPAMLTIVPVI